jgi:hypothetical protein
MMIEIEGFVILPPLSEWDEKHAEEVVASMSHYSFGKTPTEAWRRLIHPTQYEHQDFSIIVQRCHDRGYRVKTARLIIDDTGA